MVSYLLENLSQILKRLVPSKPGWCLAIKTEIISLLWCLTRKKMLSAVVGLIFCRAISSDIHFWPLHPFLISKPGKMLL